MDGGGEHLVKFCLREGAGFLTEFGHLELSAGVLHGCLLKALEEHRLEFIQSLGILRTELAARLETHLGLWHNVVIVV